MKYCPKCSKEKDEDCFHKNQSTKDGLASYCKKCRIKITADYQRTEEGKRVHSRACSKYRRTEKGKIWKRLNARTWALKYPEKITARNAISKALQSGRLTKQPCEVCGKKKVEGHHPDYRKPLYVIWYCKEHHNELHKGAKDE